MKAKTTLFCLLSLCFLVQGAFSEDISRSLHLRLLEITEAQEPFLFEGTTVVFSVPGNSRSAGIAFAHENWNIVHPFKKNDHGVYIFYYAVPMQFDSRNSSKKDSSHLISELCYRLVIDGSWTFDRNNNQKKVDTQSAVVFSVFPIPLIRNEVVGKYTLIDDDNKTARFVFFGDRGEQVSVCGSFNGWDPFMYEMEEVEDGVYSLDLELPQGIQYYQFVYKGEKVLDSLNSRVAFNKTIEQSVNVLFVP